MEKIQRKKIKQKEFEEECYNFALTLIIDWQLRARGRVDLVAAQRLSLELSDEIQAVISEFKKGVAERGLAPK